jgi:cytidylate kinase
MAMNKQRRKYVAGAYSKHRPDAFMLAMQYIEDLEKKQPPKKGVETAKIAPAICFSRKIGGGALEIADILAGKIQLPVVDREILEHIAKDLELSKETIEFFDERYPGKMTELAAMLFSEKSFIMSDYIRNIVSAVFTFADRGSTIFVGRGTHLILPRDRVLAVRVICVNELRIKRLATILDIEEIEAKKLLGQIDKEQRGFFKKAFGKKDASPYEFDLIINCDYLTEPQGAAEIVAQAFREKFAFEATVK